MIFAMAGSPAPVFSCIDCDAATAIAFCGGFALAALLFLALHHIFKDRP